MKLTCASSYALHAVAYMAAKKTDQPIASHHVAEACGIDKRRPQTIEVDGFGDQIARGAGDGGHDRASGAGKRVEQT